jgi:hypothetical protein
MPRRRHSLPAAAADHIINGRDGPDLQPAPDVVLAPTYPAQAIADTPEQAPEHEEIPGPNALSGQVTLGSAT